MILADTSAWIEFIRATGSRLDLRMRELVAEPGRIAMTDAVVMEVLAGAREAADREDWRRLSWRCWFARTEGPADYEDAAQIFRICRARGYIVKSQLDCLIAAVAIRTELPVLHADGDFDAIAQHTPLTIAD